MVNTWRTSYFKTDGIRVLFVLPQSWTDRYIPMKMVPAAGGDRPRHGRPHGAADAGAGAAGGAGDSRSRLSCVERARDRRSRRCAREGRYVEPIVRRTLSTSTDERVRALCRRLLLTDFVTELRTALTDAGERREAVEQSGVRARAAREPSAGNRARRGGEAGRRGGPGGAPADAAADDVEP